MGSLKKRIGIVVGTRPEAIKMAPVYLALKDKFDVDFIATGQHKEMFYQGLSPFGIKPTVDLKIMEQSQSLESVLSKTVTGLSEMFKDKKYDMVLVHGDTTTTLGGALASFYNKIPCAHVEAGLRTGDLDYPYPEEANRVLADDICTILYAPTPWSWDNLKHEGLADREHLVTGNTVIDALTIMQKRLGINTDEKENLVVVTTHRRENWGSPLEHICAAIKDLALEFKDFKFVFPVHLNPVVRRVVYSVLDGIPNLELTDPMEYDDFLKLLARAKVALSDSGGIQEEGPHFGVPVILLRHVTERPEGIPRKIVFLAGPDSEKIKEYFHFVVENTWWEYVSNQPNPYGDGRASERIAAHLSHYFGISETIPSAFEEVF
ncbi:non-hydrolyzing UDP-N-acetylglucosamine 2-epimerase [Coprothermobacter platensis]|uniref:non-hydrolyzing UDP-N-acetylglucosamine 2-epimerase n=1 Tax=Coprothermobacter platensis TaxID=108819 RepID=UPI00035F3266|nr:UDP-N-acetylglucosamine 2-epimerase (non-hydrolyzing) [Coprothermobacter platensis]